jgi:hypothetical protein
MPGDRDTEVRRRRKMAAIFGDHLPERTRDEMADDPADDARGGAGDDEWLRSQVPPHHG